MSISLTEEQSIKQSLILFTKPISFLVNEAMIEPIRWEKIVISNDFLNLIYIFLNSQDSTKYNYVKNLLESKKSHWLSQLAKIGYTAVRLSVSYDDNGFKLITETTKESFKN